MSESVLPSFPGLSWNVVRRPVFNNVVKRSASNREFRGSLSAYPLWEYKLSYEVLRARTALTEMQQLAAFFCLRGGDFDTWLYSDPDDNTATLASFGTGNGTTTAFQLLRSFGGFTEPVYCLNAAPAIYKGGVLQVLTTDYTVSTTGVVTFVVAPAAALTWTGTYYFRCRFLKGMLEFNQFMKQFWELRSLEFVTVKP